MTEIAQSALPVRFGAFEFDPRARQLRKHGHTIRLHGQPLEILGLLLERPAEVVLREELRAKLWPEDTFVDFEHSLNAAVNKLREALGDDANSPRFIETVPRRGYRFIAAVERALPASAADTTNQDVPAANQEAIDLAAEKSGAAPAGRRTQWWKVSLAFFGCASLVALFVGFNGGGLRQRFLGRPDHGAIRSLAVLPLENLSRDPAQEYFADGMTDALITDLAQISDVRVISRTSAMQYKGVHKSLPEIAKALGVDAVVEGSVVRSGGKVRITAQLIHAPSDRHLWAESFEGPTDDILSIQDNVARAIADRVEGKLNSQTKGTVVARNQINPDAYEAYVRGLYFFDKRGAEASRKSAEYFRKAITADPHFALAYAGLAEALPALNWFNGKPPVEAMPEAMAAAKRALELDDRLAEAHTAIGGLLSLYDWNWSEAEKELKRSLELNPNSSLAHERYTMWLQSRGRIAEALVEARQAQHLDPLSFFINRELGRSLYLARRYEEALEQLHKSEELEPHSSAVWSWVSQIYEQQGREKEAIELRLEQRIDISQAEIPSLRQAFAAGGSKGYWAKWIQLHVSGESATATPYLVAVAEARLGHADKAWEWMEKSADQREVWVTWIKVDPLLDNVRFHPGYQKLLRRINLAD